MLCFQCNHYNYTASSLSFMLTRSQDFWLLILCHFHIIAAKLRYIWRTHTRYSVFFCTFVYGLACFLRITYRTSARSASAMPTKAAPPLLLPAVGEPPANPFSAKKKKFGGGKSQKKAKGAAGGARAGLPAQAARLTHSQLRWNSVRAKV